MLGLRVQAQLDVLLLSNYIEPQIIYKWQYPTLAYLQTKIVLKDISNHMPKENNLVQDHKKIQGLRFLLSLHIEYLDFTLQFKIWTPEKIPAVNFEHRINIKSWES